MSILNSIYQIINITWFCLRTIIERIVKNCIPAKFQMKDISGDIALITGGGGGLGRLLALKLAKLGAIIVVWDINEEGIKETVKLIQSTGNTCYGYVCDVCNSEDIYKKAVIVKEEVGQVSILINNAGIANGTIFWKIPDYLLKRIMDVNIMSHFWTVKAFLPTMIENNKGHIVNIASMAGFASVPKLVDYCTSKHAALGFGEALRIELENEGYDAIKITVICPYFLRNTAMFNNRYEGLLSNLSPNKVADQIIKSLRCNHELVMIPKYFYFLIPWIWILPWPCVSKIFRKIVTNILPMYQINVTSTTNEKTTEISIKNQNDGTIHQQLSRHTSSSERKP